MRPAFGPRGNWQGTLSIAILASLAGCASNQQAVGPTSSILLPVSTTAAAAEPSAGGHILSASEQELDCKQLTGRMQIRILEIRDYNERQNTTLAARAMQSAVTGILGGPSAGKDPSGAYAKDRAMLNAYNGQLAAKKCKTYNLDDELKPKDFRATPVPSAAPPAKAK